MELILEGSEQALKTFMLKEKYFMKHAGIKVKVDEKKEQPKEEPNIIGNVKSKFFKNRK